MIHDALIQTVPSLGHVQTLLGQTVCHIDRTNTVHPLRILALILDLKPLEQVCVHAFFKSNVSA